MQTRTRNALVFAAAAAVAAAGFAVVTRARRPADLASHAVDAVPAGALLVATADLAALRASPVGAPFLREGREIPGLGKVRDVCGFDPMDTLTEAAIAIPAGGDSGEFGLVAAGPVDAERILACATKVIEARGGRPVTSPVGSFQSVRDASLSSEGGEIAVRPGGLLLLGAGAYLRAMIDAADGRSPTIRSSVGHTFLDREVGDASVRITVVLSPEQRRSLADELQSAGAAGSPAGSILAGGVGVKLGPMVGLHAVVTCADAPSCASLARSFGEARDARAADLSARVPGLGALFSQIRIDSDGPAIHARLDVPAEQAAVFAENLAALQRGMRHPRPSPEPTPAAAAPPPRPDEVIVPGTKKDGGAGSAPLDAGTKR